jgi:hypothetical protein
MKSKKELGQIVEKAISYKFYVIATAVQNNLFKACVSHSLQNKLPICQCISLFDRHLFAKFYCSASASTSAFLRLTVILLQKG